MSTLEVALIPIGEERWAALLTSGQVILSDTKHPRVEVAAELLLQGVDPRTQLIIRSGARLVANDMIGVIGGGPVVCGDVDVIERD